MDKKRLRKKIEKKLREEIERELRAKIRKEFGATTLEESQESEEDREVTHASYFYQQFAKIKVAMSFFLNYFPKEICGSVEWDTLRLAPGDFVRKALRDRRSDILYEVTLLMILSILALTAMRKSGSMALSV